MLVKSSIPINFPHESRYTFGWGLKECPKSWYPLVSWIHNTNEYTHKHSHIYSYSPLSLRKAWWCILGWAKLTNHSPYTEFESSPSSFTKDWWLGFFSTTLLTGSTLKDINIYSTQHIPLKTSMHNFFINFFIHCNLVPSIHEGDPKKFENLKINKIKILHELPQK
jgi:hypothetical protein